MEITNIKIYDMDESVAASGYPMQYDMSESEVLERDLKRAGRLSKNAPGTGHNNFLSGILVSFDITCSVKMWTQMQRYHFLQIVSSQSTMHKIVNFHLPAQCNGYVDDFIIHRLCDLQNTYAGTGDDEDFLKLLYSCPVGLELRARVSTNFLQLKTIYQQRRYHRLPEWQRFCDWIEDLPHSDWITNNGTV